MWENNKKPIDHVILELKTINNRIRVLYKILDEYDRRNIDGKQISLYGSDIRYIKKELSNFTYNLEKTINSKLQNDPSLKTDMYGREYLGLSKYSYAELVFSTDFSKISSIRMLSSEYSLLPEKMPDTYIIFGLDNPYDPSIIDMIVNLDTLIPADIKKEAQECQELSINKIDLCNIAESAFDFLVNKTTILPIPQMSGQSNYANLVASLGYGSEKTEEELAEENKKLDLISVDLELYKKHAESFIVKGSLEELRNDAQRLINKIRDSGSNCPDDILVILFLELFEKFNIAKIISDLIDCACKNAFRLAKENKDIVGYISANLGLAAIIGLINKLPCQIGDKVLYELGINLINVEQFLQNCINKIIQESKGKKKPDSIQTINVSINGIVFDSSNLLKIPEVERINIAYDIKKDLNIINAISYIEINYPPWKYPHATRIIDEELRKYFDSSELLKFISQFTSLDSLLNLMCGTSDFQIPKITIPSFQIPDLFIDISLSLENIVFGILRQILSSLSLSILSRILTLNICEDIIDRAVSSMFNLPDPAMASIFSSNSTQQELSISKNTLSSSSKNIDIKLLFRDSWSEFLDEINKILQQMKQIKQETSGDKTINDILSQFGNLNKLKKELDVSKCDDINNVDTKIKELTPKIPTLEQALSEFKINGFNNSTKAALLNNIKNLKYSEIHSFLINQNERPDKRIIDILRKMGEMELSNSKTNSGANIQTATLNLEYISNNLDNITSGMIQLVIQLLNSGELVDLFAGDYSEESGNIVRNAVKFKYPELASIMDPIKYFIILGKISGLDGLKKQMSSL